MADQFTELYGHNPTDKPGPREVLQALRQVIADNPRLKIAPPNEIVPRLIAGGYLSEEPSPALVADLLEIQRAGVRAGGMGLRSPTTLVPCLLELVWDDYAGCLRSNLDLSLFIEWVGSPADIGEKVTLPKKLTHARTPSCTDLISDPAGVLRNKERWPIHLCTMEFLRQSTESWAQTQAFMTDKLTNYRWASMHPLPIGWRALTENSEVDNLWEWSEVLNVLPFPGYEKAMWALRVEVQGGVLDLFGLEDYPTEYHKAHDIPVAGELAYRLRGTDTSLTDLVHEAKRWWSPFRGLMFLGRPKGTGRWRNREHFLAGAKAAVIEMRVEGEKITQETVAARLFTTDRMLRDWIKRFGSSWLEIMNE